VSNIHQNGSQRKSVEREIMPALLIPETGTALHTIAAPGGLKILANVDMRPGDGLPARARRIATEAHDVVQVYVHADICGADGDFPVAPDFHSPTLFWALENSENIALWCEHGTSQHFAVSYWLVNAAHAGYRFQTIVNATPEHAAHWLAHIHRWKGERARVRVFGREALQ
jgi:hypothetical protein